MGFLVSSAWSMEAGSSDWRLRQPLTGWERGIKQKEKIPSPSALPAPPSPVLQIGTEGRRMCRIFGVRSAHSGYFTMAIWHQRLFRV